MRAGEGRTTRPSVLDRLIDESPDLSMDPSLSLGESVQQYKRSVLRDLEWLLNCRRTIVPVPEELSEVLSSVFVYGLADVTSLDSDSDPTRRELLRRIERCIEVFEPRLTSVRVTMKDATEEGQRSVHFVVDGILLMDPNPERVLFDTVLDVASGRIQVGG